SASSHSYDLSLHDALPIFAAFFLLKGEGLRGLINGYVIAAIITTIANYVLVRKLLPEIALNPFQFDRSEARKMFGYSLRLYFTQDRKSTRLNSSHCPISYV